MRGDRRRCRSTRPEGLAERKLRSQLVNNMAKVSFFRFGLRYNEKATVPGAQTERRGEAGPVSVLLRGWDSPAAFLYPQDFLRLGPEAAQLLGVRPVLDQQFLVLLHPGAGPVVPLAGLVLVAEPGWSPGPEVGI